MIQIKQKRFLAMTQKGFSLLEVLIALGILAVTFIGIAGTETIALTSNYQAYLYTVAAIQLTGMLERNQINVASKEVDIWNQINASLLPHGNGRYSESTNTVSLCWFSRLTNKMSCISSN